MSGLTEILVIIAIILAIIVLPGRLGKRSQAEKKPRMKLSRLNGWVRMAILISFLWLSFFAFLLKPWNNQWHLFIYTGIGPVIIFWGIFWTVSGFKKKSS